MFTLKTHNGKESTAAFYILNKGMNAGKPLVKPCPNCFEVHLEKSEDFQTLYWLLYALWQAKAFHPYIGGSVIPFIRKKELSDLIHHSIKRSIQTSPHLEKIQKIDQLQKHLTKQITQLQNLKTALTQNLLQQKSPGH